MNEFEMNTQYAGFYQNAFKGDFTSSKLFIFFCAFTFTASLLSISFLSNLEKKSNSSQRFYLQFLCSSTYPCHQKGRSSIDSC